MFAAPLYVQDARLSRELPDPVDRALSLVIDPVETVEGDAAAHDAIERLVAEATEEVVAIFESHDLADALVAQRRSLSYSNTRTATGYPVVPHTGATNAHSSTPTGRPDTPVSAAAVATICALRQGKHTRTVFVGAVHGQPVITQQLRMLLTQGAELRTSPGTPGRGVILIDGKIAILPLAFTGSSRLAIVREPVVVGWLGSTFEHFWNGATQFRAASTAPVNVASADATRLRILRLMAAGEKDEVIARRLSISVRTCRRHIADYLEQVGASSRFQAGMIAAQNGLLATPNQVGDRS